MTGQKAQLSNYSLLDLVGGISDGDPLSRSNFPGNVAIGFPEGQSSVIVTFNGNEQIDGCLFSELQQAQNEQPGLRQYITDCTVGTAGRAAAGGGNIAVWVWNAGSPSDPSDLKWIVLGPSQAVPSSPVSQFLARTSGLSATEQAAYVALINGLVSDGVWDLLDVLYIFATNTTATAALNLKSPDFTAAVHGTLTFTADVGWQGDGSTGYLDPGFAPSAVGNNFLQNWASAGLYDLTSRTSQSSSIETGVDVNYYDLILAPLSVAGAGGFAYALCGASFSNSGIVNLNAQGSYAVSRTFTSTVAYKNGLLVNTNNSDTSGFLSAFHPYIFANNGGSPSAFSSDQLSAWWCGGGLSTTQIVAIQARINTYMTALGINVY